MKRITIALLAVTTVAGSAMATERPGASARSPGHEMQENGSRKGSPGASGYAPGHEMKSDATGTTSRGSVSQTNDGRSGTTTRR